MKTITRQWGLVGLRALSLLGLGLLAQVAAAQPKNMVGYAGNQGNERFHHMLKLSDGTVLVAGRSTNLSWIPATATVSQMSLPAGQLANADSSAYGFIAHFSRGMDTLKAVVHFPQYTVSDVFRIKTNTAPGQPTGDIYISGNRDRNFTGNRRRGYYIARLNNNFLNGAPTAANWVINIEGKPRSTNQFGGPFPNNGQDPDHKLYQPWDVAPNGRIYAVTGTEFEADWASLYVYRGIDGRADTVQNMTWHQARIKGKSARGIDTSYTTELRGVKPVVGDSIWARNGVINGTPQFDSLAVDSVIASGIILKVNRNGSNLRSYTLADYNLLQNDENGNPGRKGKFPEDLFYAAPCTTGCNNAGPGYTKYSHFNPNNNTATNRCVAVVVDKRNGNLYYGASSYSQLEGKGPHDFEGYVVSLDPTGGLRWWARMNREDTIGTTAGQLVDALDIDYNRNELVVLGRTLGNDSINFWEGNTLTASPGASGVLNRLPGARQQPTEKEASWLARYDLNTLRILRSTYVAELERNVPVGLASNNVFYDGWMEPNSPQYTDYATTRLNSLYVDPTTSRVLVTGFSEGRTLTTLGAFMPMLKPDRNSLTDSLAATNSFVRLYSAQLDTIHYSSLLTGVWDPITGTQGGNINLVSAVTQGDEILVTGWQGANGALPNGPQVPTINVPTWASAIPNAGAALFARLVQSCGSSAPETPANIVGPAAACQGVDATYRATRSTGATAYAWGLPGSNFSGASTADTLLLRGSAGLGGNLRVVAINDCGVSGIKAIPVSPPGTTPRPASFVTAPGATNPHCEGTTRTYRISQVQNATRYRWILPAGWSAVPATDTLNVTDSIRLAIAPGTPSGGQIQVQADGVCGYSISLSRSASVATAPPTPTINQINATTLQSSATTGNQWLDANMNPIPGATARNLTIPANANGVNYYVRVTNTCGSTLSAVFTGLEDRIDLAGKLTLSPNPTQGKVSLRIEAEQPATYQIKVRDLLGRTIMLRQLAAGESIVTDELDLSAYSDGLYFVEVSNGRQSSIRRIVKR